MDQNENQQQEEQIVQESTQDSTQETVQVQEIVQEPVQQNQENSQADQLQSFSANIAHLALIIDSIDNTYLLNRPCLENLCNMFQIAQPGDFDDVSDIPSLVTLIEQQYQKKRSDLEQIIYQLMRGYDELNQKVNLNQLEKIMRILKSKNKSIYIFKDEIPNFCQCSCKGQQQVVEQQNEENEENLECEQIQQNQEKESNNQDENIKLQQDDTNNEQNQKN